MDWLRIILGDTRTITREPDIFCGGFLPSEMVSTDRLQTAGEATFNRVHSNDGNNVDNAHVIYTYV